MFISYVFFLILLKKNCRGLDLERFVRYFNGKIKKWFVLELVSNFLYFYKNIYRNIVKFINMVLLIVIGNDWKVYVYIIK